ncbi:MAG: hypothetical protein OHK0029_05880 [Armatimonadaceae bacterium]
MMHNLPTELTPDEAAERDLWRAGALPHVPYALQAAFVHGRLDNAEAELVETHLDECPQCAAEVADLRALLPETAAPVTSPREFGTSGAASNPSNEPRNRQAKTDETPDRAVGLGGMLRRWFSLPGRGSGWAVAAAALVLLTAGTVAFWCAAVAPLHQSLAQIQTELASLRQPMKTRGFHAVVSPDNAPAPVFTPSPSPPVGLATGTGGQNVTGSSEYQALAQQLTQVQKRVEKLKTENDRLRTAVANASATPSVPRSPLPSPPSGTMPTPAILPATLNLPNLARLALVPPGARRGSPSETVLSFPAVSPVATAVLPVRPTLRWQPFPDAAAYRVTVRSVDGATTLTSPVPIRRPYWVVSEDLPRGKALDWQAVALDARGERIAESSVARFLVLPETDAQTYRQRIKKAGTTGAGAVAAAAEAGLLEQAEQQLDLLLATASDPIIRTRAEAWREQLSAARSRLLTGVTEP